MIKHYDRFIGGHDRAAINHLATSNARHGEEEEEEKEEEEALTTMSHPPRLRFSKLAKKIREHISERYSARVGEKGRGGFSRCTLYIRVACAGSVK